jgi:hypothetical protein
MNKHCHRYTPEEIRFIKNKITGRSYAEITELFNEHFDLNGDKKITRRQMQNFLARHKLRNGLIRRFQTGQAPRNKGRKGYSFPGSEKGWFRRGNTPHNHQPVGAERVTKLGYVEVKISEPNKWQTKHSVIWEKARGKIPKGSVIIFADGNKLNMSIDNLIMVSRRELAVMNKFHLISVNVDLTKIGKSVADIKMLIAERRHR